MRGVFFRWAVVVLLVMAAVWSVTAAQPFPRFFRNGSHPTTEWNGIHLIARQTGRSGFGTDVTLEYWRDHAGRWREEVIDAGHPFAIGMVSAYDGSKEYELLPSANSAEATLVTDKADEVGAFFSPVKALML